MNLQCKVCPLKFSIETMREHNNSHHECSYCGFQSGCNCIALHQPSRLSRAPPPSHTPNRIPIGLPFQFTSPPEAIFTGPPPIASSFQHIHPPFGQRHPSQAMQLPFPPPPPPMRNEMRQEQVLMNANLPVPPPPPNYSTLQHIHPFFGQPPAAQMMTFPPPPPPPSHYSTLQHIHPFFVQQSAAQMMTFPPPPPPPPRRNEGEMCQHQRFMNVNPPLLPPPPNIHPIFGQPPAAQMIQLPHPPPPPMRDEMSQVMMNPSPPSENAMDILQCSNQPPTLTNSELTDWENCLPQQNDQLPSPQLPSTSSFISEVLPETLNREADPFSSQEMDNMSDCMSPRTFHEQHAQRDTFTVGQVGEGGDSNRNPQPSSSTSQQQPEDAPQNGVSNEGPVVAEQLPGYVRRDLQNQREFLFMVRARLCPHCQSSFSERDELFAHLVNDHWAQIGEGAEAGAEAPELPNPIQLQLTRQVHGTIFRLYEVDLSNTQVLDVRALFQSIKKQYQEAISGLLQLPDSRNIKAQFHIKPHFYKMKTRWNEEKKQSEEYMEHKFPQFMSHNFTVENQHSINFAHRTARDNFEVRIQQFLEDGSQWVIGGIVEFTLIVTEYNPISGGVSTLVPPCFIPRMHCLISVPDCYEMTQDKRYVQDEKCFLRCIMAALYGHEARGTNYRRTLQGHRFYKTWAAKAAKEINMQGIKYPVKAKDIEKFERQNPSIGINLFSWDPDRTRIDCISEEVGEAPYVPLRKSKKEHTPKERAECSKQIRSHMYPTRICKKKKRKIIDLLLIEDGDRKHYLWIKNLHGLLKHPKNPSKIICRYCFGSFNKLAKTHAQVCPALGLMRVDFPKENFLEFDSWAKTIPNLHIATADFESVLQPVQDSGANASTITSKHVASSYSWAIANRPDIIYQKPDRQQLDNSRDGIIYPDVSEDEKLEDILITNTYTATEPGENLGLKMIRELQEKANKFEKDVTRYNIIANRDQSIHCAGAVQFTPERKCGFCKKKLGRSKAVRHHQHYPPYQFEFWAHKDCNIQAQTSSKLVVLMHNLMGYDASYIIKACAALPASVNVDIIGTSIEKIFSISIGRNLMFLDSLNFFQSSLDTVVGTLKKETDFVSTRRHFNRKFGGDKDKVELMLRKGVYPYAYMDSIERYNETELPPQSAFFNDLTKTPCSDEDYQHAQKVWSELRIKDMREYTEIYNEQDVVLLMDAFNNLRKIFIKKFEMDPLHFFSLPHLSWQCALKSLEDIQLEYIKDHTMHAWLESAKRGGVAAGCELRAATANNPYIEGYDKTKPTTYLMAFDLVNLYGAALSTYLPTSDFRWVNGYTIEKIQRDPTAFLNSLDNKRDGKGNPIIDTTGYHLEVDLEFPKNIQDKMVGLTPVPYQRVIHYEELSDFQRKFADELEISKTTLSTERLVTDFYPRRNYVVHYRVLQLYVKLGVKITKVHRAMTYKQYPVLAKYINTLSTLRQQGGSDFEKSMWKLAANAVYGKSVESVRDRTNFILVKDRARALRYSKKSTVASVHFIDTDDGSDLVILRMKKLSVTLNKPLFLGVTVLDEAKRILYKWYYEYALPKWNKQDEQRFWSIATDTDSIYCLVETQNIYDDIYNDKEGFDMSGYDEKSPIWYKYYDGANCKVPGRMKDENPNKVMKSMVFLRPKSYMFELVDAKDPTLPDGDTPTTDTYSKMVMKNKGTPKATMLEQVSKQMYMEALEKPIQRNLTNTCIVKKNQNLYTMVRQLKGLSGFDMKRYILNEYMSYPYGYHLIKAEDDTFVPPHPTEEDLNPNTLAHWQPPDPRDKTGYDGRGIPLAVIDGFEPPYSPCFSDFSDFDSRNGGSPVNNNPVSPAASTSSYESSFVSCTSVSSLGVPSPAFSDDDLEAMLGINDGPLEYSMIDDHEEMQNMC